MAFLRASAASLAMPSLTGVGAASTKVLASDRPRPVASRTAFNTLILAAGSKPSRMTSNSVFSSTASAAAAGAAIITAPADAAADTPKASSICFTSSEASSKERVFNDSRIWSVLVDMVRRATERVIGGSQLPSPSACCLSARARPEGTSFMPTATWVATALIAPAICAISTSFEGKSPIAFMSAKESKRPS